MELILVQSDTIWQNPEENRKHISQLLRESGLTTPAIGDSRGILENRIIILPEMFTTGFTGNFNYDHEESLRTIDWMKEISKLYEAPVTGSIPFKQTGKLYNRMYFVVPGGKIYFYDKRHLFRYGGENRYFTQGEKRVIVEWMGVRVLLQICYDLRFPVFSRNHKDYDVIIFVANWPETRIYAWDTLLKARAMENVCFVAAVNRVGQDAEGLNYNGHSAVIDYKGNVLNIAGDDKECVIRTFINIDELTSFREKFPVLEDADEFVLKDH